MPTVVRFARKAPRKMAGHTRRPSTRRAARAMPVGAQTGVALAMQEGQAEAQLGRDEVDGGEARENGHARHP